MARVHSKNVNMAYNSVNMESELDSVEMAVAVPESEITSFADAWQNFLAGSKENFQTTMQGTYDPTAGTAFKTLLAGIGSGPQSTVFDPTGAGPNTNDPEYQNTASGLTGALVASLSLTLPVGEKASFSATLQHSGLVSRATS